MSDSDRPTPIGEHYDTIPMPDADPEPGWDIDETGDRAAMLPSDAIIDDVTT